MTGKPLTPKQQAFLEEYLRNGRNASAAYRHAYDTSRMKEATVNSRAYEMLRHGEIAARLVALAKDSSERLQVTAEDVTLSAARAMLASLKRTLGPDGIPLPMQDWPDDLWLAIDSYEIDHIPNVGVFKTKVKLTSRAVARDQLAKHLGWYEADNKQKGAAILDALSRVPTPVAERLKERLRAVAARRDTGAVGDSGHTGSRDGAGLTH